MISYAPKISADKLSTAGRNSFGQSSIHMSLNKLYLDCWEIMHLVPGDDWVFLFFVSIWCQLSEDSQLWLLAL